MTNMFLTIHKAIKSHGKKFTIVWTALLNKLSYSALQITKLSRKRIFARNSFLIRPHALIKLMKFMNEAMMLSILNDEVRLQLKRDAHYKSMNRSVASQIFHTDQYYEFYPFIFERLPVFYSYAEHFSIYFHDRSNHTSLQSYYF